MYSSSLEAVGMFIV